MDNLINRLLEASSWQDSLLQSYRSLHLTIQSILLATSAGLFIALVTIENFYSALATFLVMIFMFYFQHFITKSFKRIIIMRGEDVNFWHREILLAEQELTNSQRYFTKFKIYQKLQREDSDFLQDKYLSTKKITSDDVELLIEKGLGHTRYAIDNELFSRITKIWILFSISGGLFILYRIYSNFLH
mgnify:CR=1 FL=1